MPERPVGQLAHFDNNSQTVVDAAIDVARQFNHLYVGTEHLLLAATGVEPTQSFFHKLGIEPGGVAYAIDSILGRYYHSLNTLEIEFTPTAVKAIDSAMKAASRYKVSGQIPSSFIVIGLMAQRGGLAIPILKSLGVGLNKIRKEAHLFIKTGLETS